MMTYYKYAFLALCVTVSSTHGICASVDEPSLLVFVSGEESSKAEKMISTSLSHILPSSDFIIHENQEHSPLPQNISDWITHAQAVEKLYFDGQFQKVLSATIPLLQLYEQMSPVWKINIDVSSYLIRTICFKALCHRVLRQPAEYTQSLGLLLKIFPSIELSSQQFPDDFIAQVNNQRRPPNIQFIDHHLPLDTTVLSESTWHTDYIHGLLANTDIIRTTYPKKNIWIFQTSESHVTRFCAFYHRTNQWQCENRQIHTVSLGGVLPLLYKNYVATHAHTKSLDSLQSLPQANLNIQLPDHHQSSSSLPWWIWATGAAVVGGVAMVLVTSQPQSPSQSDQVTGTFQFP